MTKRSIFSISRLVYEQKIENKHLYPKRAIIKQNMLKRDRKTKKSGVYWKSKCRRYHSSKRVCTLKKSQKKGLHVVPWETVNAKLSLTWPFPQSKALILCVHAYNFIHITSVPSPLKYEAGGRDQKEVESRMAIAPALLKICVTFIHVCRKCQQRYCVPFFLKQIE
jgi:hypothetical protein